MTPKRPARPRQRGKAEWVTFGLAIVVLTVLVVVIVALWVAGSAPASIVVHTVESPRPDRGGYLVTATVANRGDATAADVQVVATLRGAGEEVSAEQRVPFLAGSEERELIFRFETDPRSGALGVRVASYRDP